MSYIYMAVSIFYGNPILEIDHTRVTFLVSDMVQNPEFVFGHQMGPEQTLRRETLTDRRQISVRVSFIFEKARFYTKIPEYVISGNKRNVLRHRTPAWVSILVGRPAS